MAFEPQWLIYFFSQPRCVDCVLCTPTSQGSEDTAVSKGENPAFVEFVLQRTQLALSSAFWTLILEKILSLSRLFCLVGSAEVRWQWPGHLDEASPGLVGFIFLFCS